MDLNRLMRSLLPLAVIAAAAGCTSGGGESSDDGGGQASEESTASSLEGVTDPVELELEAPNGFAADDAVEREVPVAEGGNDYGFSLDGGDGTARILVSTYVLDQEIDDTDYEAIVGLVREYDATLGKEFTAENDRRTIVHGRDGVGMLIGYEEDGAALVQQNHYLFEASHLIQITCQWTNADFSATYTACQDMLAGFPFPEGWDS